MTDRILKADLDHMAEYLDEVTNHSQGFRVLKVTGDEFTDDSQGFRIHNFTKGWKLVRHGDWYISPVLPKRELYEWIWAYLYGIRDGQKILTTK